MNIFKLEGIGTKEKWFYDDQGEKTFTITEIYFLESERDEKRKYLNE
tara:strand:- start:514 stop:654 length:141 start_codon:yes stop_codon:yes gene_type:complete